MTWTYGADPANSERDAVRILIGDTDPSDPIMTDEVLDFILTEEPNFYYAASRAAMAMAATMTRLERRDDATRYMQIAQDLYTRGFQYEPGEVFTGGITRTGIPEPSDLPDLFFEREMHDNT